MVALVLGLMPTRVHAIQVPEQKSFAQTGSIDLIDIINNPKEYPDTQIKVETADEFLQTINNDVNLTSIVKQNLIQDVKNASKQKAVEYKFITIHRTVKVNNAYSCYPYFYFKCEAQAGIPAFFVTLLNADIDRNYRGVTKQFSGRLFCNIESKTKFYWDLNGDFYDNGNTTVGGGVDIGINESVNFNFSVSYSSNHYAYIQYDERYTLKL